jgi:cytochrome c553
MDSRRTRIALAAMGSLCAAVGCSAGGGPDEVSAYLSDPAFRRAELVASLVEPRNGYSQQRLAHYATGDAADWDRLPEWNPPAEEIRPDELDAPGGASDRLSPRAAPLELPEAVSGPDDPRLLTLGALAFRRYPTQIAPYFRVALSSRPAAARYGLWIDGAGVGGLVRARMADGSGALALTCSSCHAALDAHGALAAGLPNRDLDLGRAIIDAEGEWPIDGDPVAGWGPGRLDVTTAAGVEPVRIPDLRPTRWLSHLQHDATVRARTLTALAIRIETLLVTSGQQVLRPPRVVALALASYLTSLGAALPAPERAAQASPRGAAIFAARCAGCHAPPGLTGPPVPLAAIGTDPALGLSSERGTGAYRVPSLRGVGTRGPLLHDGTLPSLEALFEPGRQTAGFPGRLHGPGPVSGHAFGLDLIEEERAALIAYLRAL